MLLQSILQILFFYLSLRLDQERKLPMRNWDGDSTNNPIWYDERVHPMFAAFGHQLNRQRVTDIAQAHYNWL